MTFEVETSHSHDDKLRFLFHKFGYKHDLIPSIATLWSGLWLSLHFPRR